MSNLAYESFGQDSNVLRHGSFRKFYVIVSGNSLGAHYEFIQKLKAFGQSEVRVFEEADYILAFCIVSTRIGTDIQHAMESCPSGDKPILLVVAHATCDCEKYVAPRRVPGPNVFLSVDCLFNDSHLLDCNQNVRAFTNVKSTLGCQSSEAPGKIACFRWSSRHYLILGAILLVILIFVLLILYLENKI